MIACPEDLTRPAFCSGQGQLEVRNVGGLSTVTSARATSPFKLLVPCPRSESAWAYSSSFGGGMVSGDTISIEVSVDNDAKCFIGTQASTKIYKATNGQTSSQFLTANVGRNGLLVLAPDPVQAFSESDYLQRQTFHLAPDAGLVLVDWFTSGRASRGERWEFNQFQSSNEIFLNEKRILMDSLRLSATEGPLIHTGRMGRFNCIAMVAFAGKLIEQASQKLLEQISESPIQKRSPLIVSASPIEGGTILRIAGESVENVGKEIQTHLSFLAELLGDDPWKRKW